MFDVEKMSKEEIQTTVKTLEEEKEELAEKDSKVTLGVGDINSKEYKEAIIKSNIYEKLEDNLFDEISKLSEAYWKKN